MSRWLLIIMLILLVPIVPFVLTHHQVDQWVNQLAASSPSPQTVCLWVIGLLATDVFLPVPSSFVSTLAGGTLPAWMATLASWIGLTIGAVLGFAVARTWGRPFAEWLAGGDELERAEKYRDRYATAALVFTRALPILAEACVLMYGVQKLSWDRFLPPVIVSNLGIAIAYSFLGHYAAEHEWLTVALSVSIAFPLLLTLFVRRRQNRLS